MGSTLELMFLGGSLQSGELDALLRALDCSGELYGLIVVTCIADQRIDISIREPQNPGPNARFFFSVACGPDGQWVPLGLRLLNISKRQRWWAQSLMVWFSRNSDVRVVVRDQEYEREYDLCMSFAESGERFRLTVADDFLSPAE